MFSVTKPKKTLYHKARKMTVCSCFYFTPLNIIKVECFTSGYGGEDKCAAMWQDIDILTLRQRTK